MSVKPFNERFAALLHHKFGNLWAVHLRNRDPNTTSNLSLAHWRLAGGFDGLTTEDLVVCGCTGCRAEINDRVQQGQFGETPTLFVGIVQPRYKWTEQFDLSPLGWTEFRSGGRATISVPIGDSPLARGVRLHELMHARFTPEIDAAAKTVKMIMSPLAVQIAEDIRLGHKQRALGLGGPDYAFPLGVLRRAAVVEPVISYMAAYGSEFEDGVDVRDIDVYRSVSGATIRIAERRRLWAWRTEVDRIVNAGESEEATFARLATATHACLSDLRLGQNDERPDDEGATNKWGPPQFVGIDVARRDGDAIVEIVAGIADQPPVDAAPKSPRSEIKDDDEKNYTLDPSETCRWGAMEARVAPMVRSSRPVNRARGVAAPDGAIPSRMHRWFGDRHVFERVGRRPGGTLLIDISGSMSWAHEQTQDLIERIPAMTVAVYSGHTKDGHLTIIARSGRVVASGFNARAFGHGLSNVVDGHALAWLARQPKPRVWFCDGRVTGIGDSMAGDLSRDAERLQRLGGIIRTTDIGEVMKILTGSTKTVPKADDPVF